MTSNPSLQGPSSFRLDELISNGERNIYWAAHLYQRPDDRDALLSALRELLARRGSDCAPVAECIVADDGVMTMVLAP